MGILHNVKETVTLVLASPRRSMEFATDDIVYQRCQPANYEDHTQKNSQNNDPTDGTITITTAMLDLSVQRRLTGIERPILATAWALNVLSFHINRNNFTAIFTHYFK